MNEEVMNLEEQGGSERVQREEREGEIMKLYNSLKNKRKILKEK